MAFAFYRAALHARGASGGASPTTTRGFTGHEMVDGTGVIHMNGRIYDAALGRFLQPDPLVQSPDNAQSWNAYTYVFNNPLAYTDPTGMFSFRQALGFAIAVIGTILAPQGGGTWAKLGYAIAIGFASGYVATGTFRGGVIGAFTAAVAFGVAGLDLTGRVAFQGVAGGIVEGLSGGRFGHGFFSAGLTTAVMPQVGHADTRAGRTALGAVLGGTLSVATGGKFANGAISGAIQGAMARVQTQRQSSQAYGTGDGTEGAPEEIAVLLKDPKTRQEGLRAMARSVDRGYMANDIYYKDQFYVNSDGGIEPYTGAVTQGRIITFYKPAFYWDYDALVSDLEQKSFTGISIASEAAQKPTCKCLSESLQRTNFKWNRTHSDEPLWIFSEVPFDRFNCILTPIGRRQSRRAFVFAATYQRSVEVDASCQTN
ncbi:RHS repeat-associated core domain-containing protein [Pseudomonas aeruginosa]|uniref:RHS repeat-associated core domain-containing protein n=1 Tax=Pseudomonas aeruginosa TaxID=287 RepID=UPI003F74B2F0